MLLQMALFHSFLGPNSIPVCVCVCVCVCTHYIFFTHLSIRGHLGCCHVLVIVDSDAMNIGVYVSF